MTVNPVPLLTPGNIQDTVYNQVSMCHTVNVSLVFLSFKMLVFKFVAYEGLMKRCKSVPHGGTVMIMITTEPIVRCRDGRCNPKTVYCKKIQSSNCRYYEKKLHSSKTPVTTYLELRKALAPIRIQL